MTARSTDRLVDVIQRLVVAIDRASGAMQRASCACRPVEDPTLARQTARSRTPLETLTRCTHPEGHALTLNATDTLTIETCRECPCCGARLWVSIPSVAEILETAANYGCTVPDLEAALTRRERQVLNLLHHSQYALRHGQLAALVWSESTRTHDVRSVLFRLRRKLQATGWTIPFPPKGQGVRLIREAPLNRPGDPDSSRQEPGEVSTTLPPFATWRSSSAAPLR